MFTSAVYMTTFCDIVAVVNRTPCSFRTCHCQPPTPPASTIIPIRMGAFFNRRCISTHSTRELWQVETLRKPASSQPLYLRPEGARRGFEGRILSFHVATA